MLDGCSYNASAQLHIGMQTGRCQIGGCNDRLMVVCAVAKERVDLRVQVVNVFHTESACRPVEEAQNALVFWSGDDPQIERGTAAAISEFNHHSPALIIDERRDDENDAVTVRLAFSVRQ